MFVTSVINERCVHNVTPGEKACYGFQKLLGLLRASPVWAANPTIAIAIDIAKRHLKLLLITSYFNFESVLWF